MNITQMGNVLTPDAYYESLGDAQVRINDPTNGINEDSFTPVTSLNELSSNNIRSLINELECKYPGVKCYDNQNGENYELLCRGSVSDSRPKKRESI